MDPGRGLSLLELLIVVLLLALLLAGGVPALEDFVRDNRRAAAVNAFVLGVHMARNEAVKRGEFVALCKSTAGMACDGAHWEDGWMLFVELDRDDPPRRDADEPVLLIQPPWPHGTIRGNRAGFTFRPFGLRSTNGTLVFCDRRGPPSARAVVVSYTGRPRTDRTDSRGRPLRCP